METKCSTWPSLQPRSSARFLKKLESARKASWPGFMAGSGHHWEELGSRVPVHCPRQVLLSKGKRRWKRNMVSSKQQLIDYGEGRRRTLRSPPKTPRLGGQCGLDLKHCRIVGLQCLLVKGGITRLE